MDTGRKYILLAMVILFVSFTPLTSYGDNYYWSGGTGSWDTPSNWSPSGPPLDDIWNTYVYMTNAPGSNATAYFTNYASMRSLQIYGTGAGTMSLSISAGYLEAIGSDIGYNGIGNQTGGYFDTIDGMLIRTGGVYNLQAGDLHFAEVPSFHIFGVFNQTGGRVYGQDNMDVRPGGVYNLSGTGVLSSGENGPDLIFAGGVFNQNGGRAQRGMGLYVGGTYNLIAGEAESYAGPGFALDNYITGTFDQSGGTAWWKGSYGEEPVSLYVGEDWGLSKSGGTYNLSGGRLVADTEILVGGIATFNYLGGEMVLGQQTGGSWVSGTLTNNGTTNLSGSGTRVIDGNVVNNGTFKTTHTTAVYTGTFTNNGAYISDPATQYFNDLIIGKNGYLIGQYNDYFYINGNFINNSTMNTDWNTMHSNLGFITGEDNLHDLYLTGWDYGAAMSGYSNNFSWGTLDIAGNLLSLYDGNNIAGAALYLREILGLDISESLIANISGMDGLNIYYMANLKDNDYLGGLVYDLSGGGHLIPIRSTPEPSTMLLLAIGFVGLVGIRRKFRK